MAVHEHVFSRVGTARMRTAAAVLTGLQADLIGPIV